MESEEAIQSATVWAYSLSTVLEEAHRRYIEKQITPRQARANNWASSLGHPCELHLTYWRTQGQLATATPLSLQRVFEEGKKQEDLILRELEMLGVRIIERGVPLSTEQFTELRISGKLDARVDVSGLDKDLLEQLQAAHPATDWRTIRPVLECKSLSPFLYDRLVDYDALMTDKRHYVRSWAEQMQLYLLGRSRDAGLFVFKNKVTGAMRFLPVLLDLETCEALAQKAQRINGHVARYQATAELPPPIDWREDVCATCPFLHLCPNNREIPITELSDQAELITLLEAREALRPALDAYAETTEQLDHLLAPHEGVNTIVGGTWAIKWSKLALSTRVVQAHWRKRITRLPAAREPVAGAASGPELPS